MTIFHETARLILRHVAQEDFGAVAAILQDPRVMYAWEHVFSDDEVREWIGKNLARYAASGLSHFLLVEKATEREIGYAGLLEAAPLNRTALEISYSLRYDCWHRGFAREAASALSHIAFSRLGASEVVFEIRPENIRSARVAASLGATKSGSFIKRYRGKDMLHDVYSLYARGQKRA